MKQPPTDRERAIAGRRAEGRTLQRVAKEFGHSAETIGGICRRVEEYDRGMDILRDDPASIEALRLLGKIKPMVQQTLRHRGIKQLTDLDGMTIAQLVTWPNIGRHSATLLLDALTKLRKTDESCRGR